MRHGQERRNELGRRMALLVLAGALFVSVVRFERPSPQPRACTNEQSVGLATGRSNVRLVCPEALESRGLSHGASDGPTMVIPLAGSGGYRAMPLPLATRRTMGLPIDLNRMSREDFEQLPGIGPALSRRIVQTRAELGGFDSIDDLERVPGIGPVRLEKLRSLLEGSGS